MADLLWRRPEWRSVEPVNKGWSSDLKYQIQTEDGQTLLLRLSEPSRLAAKQKEYEIIQ